MKRLSDIIGLLALLVVMLGAGITVAFAQPAPAASAPITFDGACGQAGVGRQYSDADGYKRGDTRPRDATPGMRVGPPPHGYWTRCTMPPPPKDCAERKAPAWLVDGRLCQPKRGRMIPGRNAPFGHDVRSDPTLRNVGIQRWRCEKIDGVAEWRSVGATCKGR